MAAALKDRPLLTFNKPDPVYSTNPILNGELIKGDQHDILYYLGRVNDPQFINWEAGVKSWLSSNQIDFSKFQVSTSPVVGPLNNPPATTATGASGAIQINLSSPQNGDFITNQINVSAAALSLNTITKIEVYLNNNLIDSKVGSFGNNYTYAASLTPDNIGLQNILVIRVTDSSGANFSKQLILFRK
ncbi:MAG: Ig-like domain-containing protein [Chloroflexi bacterium]|nr:Ig-like domain-containing protein [Chloroflexota bacterium]